MSFSNLGLKPTFATHIANAGYESPTELQQQLIPLMAQKKNALVWTQSAAGKTGAFLIPAINHILENPLEEHQGVRILILTSRRDRVNQITYTVKRLMGKDHPLRTGFIVSGRPYQPQMRLLRRPLDLMVATPGRLNDLMDNNKADFSKLELLIIDDLTTIYKKGLHELVSKIFQQKAEETPATIFVRHDEEVTPYVRSLMKDADEITIEDEKTQLQTLKQSVYLSDDFNHKLALTNSLLNNLKQRSAVIFTATNNTARSLADSLAKHGHTADSAHLLDPEERNLQDCPILIIPDEEEFLPELSGNEPIIHFEIPDKVEVYLNRLRDVLEHSERSEPVNLLISPQERDALKKLEEFQGEGIEQKLIAGLEPKHPSKAPKNNRGSKTTQRNGKNTGRPPRKPNDNKSSDNKQRGRKGPYGRLHGGGNANNSNAGSNNHPRKTQSNRSGDSHYEIGGWEKEEYTPQQNKDRKVVIRYKEKKRRLVVK